MVRVGALILAIAGAASLAMPAQAATPQIAALGDSYMAGVGAGSYTVTAGCRRSSRSYAAEAARRTRTSLADLSCPGATVAQTRAQVPGVPVTATTVLVQAGGNDVGFSTIAYSCLIPGGTTCLSDIASAEAKLPGVTAGLADIAAAVREQAPSARIVLAGYPSLLADPVACSRSLVGRFLDAEEVAAIIRLQAGLDGAIRAAARASGARFADWPASVDAHSLCSTTPWFVVPLSGSPADSLHPTARAYAAMGRQTASLVRR